MITPREEQKIIIEENSDCVIIASPGSGKTYVLSEKIKYIIPSLPEYRGVIAISYTNKASNELKRRCLQDGIDKKGSFFGTIDTFFISEIIRPFGKQVFGLPINEPVVSRISEFDEGLKELFKWYNKDIKYETIKSDYIENMKEAYLHGYIALELVGILSLYIYNVSASCKAYLKARYSYVMIDEYQDCGAEQHQIFLHLQEIGLCSVAVGDINQSIYAFSGKDSKYLFALTTNKIFKTYQLTFNHRSHASIINYSARLLNPNSVLINYDKINVFRKLITGSEYQIGEWLNDAIPEICKTYSINKRSEVAILVRNNRTGSIIHNSFKTAHKYFIATPLDENSNMWSSIFRRLLYLFYDIKDTKIEMIEEYLNINSEKQEILKLIEIITKTGTYMYDVKNNIDKIKNSFIKIAEIISPINQNKDSIDSLYEILTKEELLNSFKPAKDNEVQLMTLHKSKGLEFDMVFHLDLYKYILPMFNGDYYQELNLHYVGITRARKCCVLCTSTKRNKFVDGTLKEIDAEISEFYYLKDINKLSCKLEL